MPALNQYLSLLQEQNTNNDDSDGDEIFSDDTSDIETITEERSTFRERKIHVEAKDPEIISLYDQFKEGSLILDPEFQRGYVWDNKKASRLIESAILKIPLPIVYLSEENDDKIYVIDGQQRLTTFFAYLDGKFPDGRDFRLTGLIPEHYNYERKLFKDLEREVQNKIKRCSIKTITISKDSDVELKFDIFERLNSGAVSLNEQELRNCIYRGTYNRLLKELSEEPDFRYLLGLERPEKRMKDIQLVLRFAAFFHSTHHNYKPAMKSFLNKDMDRYRAISDADAKELRRAFKNSLSIIRSLFDKQSFKRMYRGKNGKPDGYWEKKQINESLYDVLMFAFAHVEKNLAYRHLDSLREGIIDLMTQDDEFISAIEKATSNLQNVKIRFTKMMTLIDSILGDQVQVKEPRCFSRELKEVLYKKSSQCSICGQMISSIDDAAIDHIYQYWAGGRTIPENARLVHRYCNLARPKHDIPQQQDDSLKSKKKSYHIPNKQFYIEIDGDSGDFDTATEVLVFTAEWLIKNGKLSPLHCPVHLPRDRGRSVMSTEPIHERMNKKFFNPKQLSNGLWIETNYNVKDSITRVEMLIELYAPDSLIEIIEVAED